ncbi:DNA mismatch repair protein MutL [Blattabacterium punctulatus CPU2]|uniref:DNA mismatch repair protein MutL n=1 Tax=Blattabacterium punctulatus CPU2 TaxID=1457032 RepID=A0AAD1CLZ4_9FLAO|nr:DNA mismatch repair endonuclease MutL [Blattabacterium punctulatus]AWU39474.1 DNA mismatch repair endonuclease MutL [Blattabacterium punctulatus]BBA17602.1 DNA mismatch repair protein MutL [Blattabacterium punctulatus CPU2]
MKDIIQFLPKKVINQIAAGEVIQRPSSVLKELLENSIDAKSKSIDIFIRDSGKTLIQLIDNGEGMSYNDARNSYQRYTTSKIRTNEDIFRINTKGFRGEALASIAFVSQLEIQTKNKKNPIGIHILVEEGKIKEQIPINMLKGTRISVKNIFYKFPARRIFLKSSKIEFKHIINEFYKIILAHRDIVYRFYHNDKIIYFLKKASLKERIKEIFIKNKKLLPILIKKNKIIIEGFISKPNSSIKKGNHFLFVNQRCINNILLHKKIIHSYEGLLKNLKTVSYFIFIYIDPILVNWNIHPTKTEVKLEEENLICNMIQQEIKNILCCQYKVKKEELNNSDLLLDFNSSKKESLIFMNHYDSFFEEFSYKEKVTQLDNWFHQMKKSNYFIDVNLTKKLSNYIFHEKKIKTFQINGKYIIFLWNNENIILVDQHRAHQNILFEFFFKERKKKLISQKFLFPIEIKLLNNEFISLKNIQYELIEMGFHLYFWNQSVYLYSIPENIHQNILVEIFQNILTYNFINGAKNNKKILIQSISKSAAVKSGTELHSNKMECLIRDFFSCKNINYTYSGDPIFFIFNKNFLKKTIL